MKRYEIQTIHTIKGQERYFPAKYIDNAHYITQNIYPGKVFKTKAAAIEAAENYFKEV